MKRLIFIFAALLILFSCSKDDAPTTEAQINIPTVKVIDKIESKIKFGTQAESLYTYQFIYTTNNEILKIEYFLNNSFRNSYSFNYVNNIPTSGQYDSAFDAFPAYNILYNFSNGIYTSFFDSQLNDTTSFAYNAEFNQYTNSINGNRIVLNINKDISIRSYGSNGNEYAFTFDETKKGPLFNVVNKSWIPLLYYGLNNIRVIEMSTYPLTSVFDDNIAQNNPVTNTYDADGFITKSVFTTSNGENIYEITYTYKNI